MTFFMRQMRYTAIEGHCSRQGHTGVVFGNRVDNQGPRGGQTLQYQEVGVTLEGGSPLDLKIQEFEKEVRTKN